jgi:hypothetical protein
VATEPKEILGLVHELSRLTGSGVELHRPSVEYPMKKKSSIWTGIVHARLGGKLCLLAKYVDRIAKAGFTPAAVTWWILLGIRPLVPRLKVIQHNGGGRTWVALEIHAQDLTWRELWNVYGKVNELHHRIFQLVSERGGIPEVGKVEFWKAMLAQLCNEKRPKLPKTWQAIRKAYCELAEQNAMNSRERDEGDEAIKSDDPKVQERILEYQREKRELESRNPPPMGFYKRPPIKKMRTSSW